MAITINIYYKGKNNDALKFAKDMMDSGVVQAIKEEKGNLKYDYFTSLNDPETVLLIDCWENQEAIDAHHRSWMMDEIMKLRDKYDLQMEVHRFNEEEELPQYDKKFIKS